jgi:hypothetical protein
MSQEKLTADRPGRKGIIRTLPPRLNGRVQSARLQHRPKGNRRHLKTR